MKTNLMTKITISTFFLFMSSLATAEIAKYANYPEQDQAKFTTISIPSGGQQIQATALQTTPSSFRFAQVEGTGTPRFVLEGPSLKAGLDAFLLSCEKYRKRGIFGHIQDKNNSYTLKGELLPFSRNTISKLLPGMVDETKYSPNQVQLPIGPEAIGPHSKSVEMNALKLREFFEKQIEKQQEQIWKTGMVEFDLTGQDALVCDLLTGGSKLKFAMPIEFPIALPERKPTITPDQFAHIARKLDALRPKKNDVLGRLVFYAGAFGKALSEATGLEPAQFGEHKFDQVARAAIDFETASLRVRPNDSNAIKRAAQNLDEKLFGMKNSNLWIQPEVVGEVR